MKLIALLTPLFASSAWCQVTENFSDSNFTVNPTWIGTTTDFIVNTSLEAQTQNSLAATSYLVTDLTFNANEIYEWQVRVKITTAPSSSNFARFFLTSNTADPTSSDGFFLQLGESGTVDAIRLKKTSGGTETEICAGPAGQIASSFNVRIKVLRDPSGNWSLFADTTAGTNFNLLASGTDTATFSSDFTGFLATYTASNASKYYFDDVYAGPEIIDTNPPELLAATPTSDTTVDLMFSEPVSGPAISSTSDYLFSPLVPISSVVQDASNGALIHLTLNNSLQNGSSYTVTVSQAQDNNGNNGSGLQAFFTYLVNESPAKGDLIISEFMCDPSPSVGLPELEYIEIYNRSSKYFDLTGWKIGDGSSNGTLSGGWISPGEYRILCATSSQPSFNGSIAVVSFPSLNNVGDAIVLSSPDLTIIDQLNYTDGWYHDDIKADGGYSIERVNQDDPCSDGDNWRASEDTSGGTPGFQNSVYNNTPDTASPWIISALATAPDSLVIVFNEAMDSTTTIQTVFSSTPALNISTQLIDFQGQHSIAFTFSENLQPSQLYSFTLNSVADCWANTAILSGIFALAEQPEPGDLVVNEILYNPGNGGSDFVEVYNRTSKILQLKGSYFATIKDDTIGNIRVIGESTLLQPNGYLVFSNDTSWVKQQFQASVAGNFCKFNLPPLNNDSATVFIFAPDSALLNKVSYNSDWQLPFIDDLKNKSLERISPDEASNLADNWHTAAESIGFGTPGRINSQYQKEENEGEFGTVGEVFSPDNDGFQDVMQFYYTMSQPDMIATVSIYNSYGQLVRSLKKSEVLGITGNFNWDGVNENQQKSVIGIYIAVFEAFSKNGDANFSKRIAFTLAGKLD